ncbi:PEP-CTERM sorting domain-containing protein [Pelomonas sp. KK5]|uniref:PEP-CTERM sorting domain-containing protein n=1 Tax=Pelomonas sp. KK5 TaxID=1855730 RepID=UPI00097C33BA|nr:PEP-CTERM sorting domain-containing protein [Pelomonas sp. KK5]
MPTQSIHRKTGKLAAVAALGLIATQAARAGAYYDLGSTMAVSDVSANGSVAAVYSSTQGQYYKWTAAGGLVSIGGNWDGGEALISDDGSIIAGDAVNAAGLTSAATYNVATGQWTTLGSLGGVSGSSVSASWAMSGDGKTVAGLGWVTAAQAHATLWTSGTVIDLGSSVSGRSTRINGLDGSGTVAVGWQELNGGSHQGSYWKNGVQTLMVDGNGLALRDAQDVSSDGTWIIGTGAPGGSAYRYNTLTNVTEYLGHYGAAADTNGLSAISADGNIIVGYDRAFGPITQGTGTIWINGQGTMNLTDYAISHGVALPTGTVLATPLAISADGLTITGLDNHSHGFVISLSPVPEPSSYAMLALGLGALGLWTRRRKELGAGLAAVALATAGGAAQAATTFYTSETSFLAAINKPVVDDYSDLAAYVGSNLSTPLTRSPGGGYSYGLFAYSQTTGTADTVYISGTAANPSVSTTNALNDVLILDRFTGGATAFGAYFYGADAADQFLPVTLTVEVLDAKGRDLMQTITPTGADGSGFVGFVSDSAIKILNVYVTSAAAADGVFPTMDHLMLGSAVTAVPEPSTCSLLLAGAAVIGGAAQPDRQASWPTRPALRAHAIACRRVPTFSLV